jgi:heat shock protein HslJ
MAVAGLLIAGASACRSAQQEERAPSAPSSAIAAVIGHQWRLTQVTASGRKVDVPDSVVATFQLTPDGRFLASDSVNALSGAYTATRTGFTVTHPATTLVAYAGTDPTTRAVIAAMNAVLLREGAVDAKTTGSTLTLIARNYQLSFREAGPAVSHPPPSPTNTQG